MKEIGKQRTNQSVSQRVSVSLVPAFQALHVVLFPFYLLPVPTFSCTNKCSIQVKRINQYFNQWQFHYQNLYSQRYGKKKSKSLSSQKNAVRLNIVPFIKTTLQKQVTRDTEASLLLDLSPHTSLGLFPSVPRGLAPGVRYRISLGRDLQLPARNPPPPCPVPQSCAFCWGCRRRGWRP